MNRYYKCINCPICGHEYEIGWVAAPASGPPGEDNLDPPVDEWIEEPICPHCGNVYELGKLYWTNALYSRVGELWQRVKELEIDNRELKSHLKRRNER